MDVRKSPLPEGGMQTTFRNEMPVAHLFGRGAQGVLGLLIVVLLLTMLGGVVRTFIDLHAILAVSVQEALRQVILDVLILLAVLEIFRTVLTYFNEGRVKVTFIVDTILVVMLAELLALWFSEADHVRIGAVLIVLTVLGGLRTLAVKFSPGCNDRELHDQELHKRKGGEHDGMSQTERPDAPPVRSEREALRPQPLRAAGVLQD